LIGQAAEVGVEADRLREDSGSSAAGCVIHLRDAQRLLNAPRAALRLSIAQISGNSGSRFFP
jgi:hypothetical protein